jgi:hypothetical protein
MLLYDRFSTGSRHSSLLFFGPTSGLLSDSTLSRHCSKADAVPGMLHATD